MVRSSLNCVSPVSYPWTYRAACRYLAVHGPSSADLVGGAVWRDRPRGRVTSSGGGGDYAAQMLLGRMKAAGLVCHSRAHREGSTRWEVTPLGRAEADR